MRALWLMPLLLSGCAPVSPTSIPPTSEPAATTSPGDRWVAPLRTKTAGCVAHDGEPDAACTPGATDPRVTQANLATTVCKAGYSATVRPSTSVTEPIKRAEMLAYGFAGLSLTDYELDHLVSLELGGAPADVANLWPEAWNDQPGVLGAHSKDKVENFLHEQVCRGAMRLADAQRAIATDWRAIATV